MADNGAIEQLTPRALTYVVGHDGSGRVGREPVTDFVKATRQVVTDTTLTGGGALSSDLTLGLSSASVASLGLANSSLQPSDVGTTVATAAQGADAESALALATDIETSARYAEATKLYYAAQMGLSPGVDMEADFDGFLEFAYNNGGRTIWSTGEYLVSQKGKIRTGTNVLGNDKTATVFKATSALLASGDAILETLNYAVNTGTQTKLVTDPTMVWGFAVKDITIDGGWNQDFTTAVTDPSKGRGLNLYGRRFEVRNVGIYNTPGVAFYMECGNPSSPPAGWYNDYRNNQDGVVEDLDIQRSAYEGFVTMGPGDTYLNRITVGIIGDTNNTGLPISSLMFPGDLISGFVMAANDTSGASGTHEIGVIHTHTCWNGWNFRAKGGSTVLVRLKAENLIAEGGLGSVYLMSGVYGQISKINTRNNNVLASSSPTTFADVRLSSNFQLDIGSIEGRKKSPFTTSNGLTGVRIDMDNVQISRIKYEGNGQPGHAVTVESGRKGIHIGSLNANNCRGTAQDGNASASLYTKSSCDEVMVNSIQAANSDYGWRNASSQRVRVMGGAIEVSSAFTSNVAGIQWDTTPGYEQAKASKPTTTDLSGNVLRPDASVIVTASSTTPNFDPTSTSEQTIPIPHSMWRTPNFQREVSLQIIFNGTTPGTVQYIVPTASDTTNVTFKIKLSAAQVGGSAGGTLLNLKIQ